MSSIDLQEIHDFLVAVAYHAGDMITSAKPAVTGHGTKKNSADLVTETDQAVEKMVSTKLKEKYDFAFIGEETYQPGDKLTSSPTFIVDPIDGTTNFFHGHPYVAVSLGLAINKKPVVGVIYNPFTKQLYSGIKGQGSHLSINKGPKQKLPLRSNTEKMQDLSHCLIAVEWGSDRSGNDYEVKTATFKKLCASKEEGGAMVHGIRSLGSAELNLCGVASGHLDVYWESGCWAWDVCAGWVIVEEAGGLMVGCHQNDWEPDVDQRRYMAVRGGDGQRAIVEEFWSCVVGRVEVGWDNVSKA